MDILQQHLKSFFIAVLWLFWFLDINKLFKCKSPLLLFHFLLVEQKNAVCCIYTFFLCVQILILDWLWIFYFLLFRSPSCTHAQMQIYHMDTGVNASGWVTQSYVDIVATSFWSRWFIYWDSIFWVEKPEWVHQPTAPWLLTTLETIISITPGLGGNHTGSSGQIPLVHKFHGHVIPSVLIPLAPAQTLVWKHHSKLDSAFAQIRNSFLGDSDFWHQKGHQVGIAIFRALI